jgi:hypothetical protein
LFFYCGVALLANGPDIVPGGNQIAEQLPAKLSDVIRLGADKNDAFF